jgi:hypothetical protein
VDHVVALGVDTLHELSPLAGTRRTRGHHTESKRTRLGSHN